MGIDEVVVRSRRESDVAAGKQKQKNQMMDFSGYDPKLYCQLRIY